MGVREWVVVFSLAQPFEVLPFDWARELFQIIVILNIHL